MMHKSKIDILLPELKPNSELKADVTTSSQTIAKPNVSGSFIIGESVYYHRQDIIRRKCFVVGIEDNGFGLWIRFAEKIDNMVVDKYVSCYDVSKNCR